MIMGGRAREALRKNLRPVARVVRALFPYGAQRIVMRGPARGLRFVIAPGMGATYALGDDAYNAREWARRVRPGMVAYDIGANCGQSSLILARLVGASGHVYSFEPWPEQYRLLERNLDLNGFRTRVTPLACAVATSSGRAEFLCDDEFPTQGKLGGVEPTHGSSSGRSISVETISLDELVARPGTRPPDMLKIDVEGAATQVLAGAHATLREHKPLVYIELHGPEEQAGVRDHLQALGYRLWRVDGSEVTDPVARWASPLWCTF